MHAALSSYSHGVPPLIRIVIVNAWINAGPMPLPSFVYAKSWLLREAQINWLIVWPYPDNWLKDTGCLNKCGHLRFHSERSLRDNRCHVWGTYLQHDYCTVAISPHLFFIFGGWWYWRLSKNWSKLLCPTANRLGRCNNKQRAWMSPGSDWVWRLSFWPHMPPPFVCLCCCRSSFFIASYDDIHKCFFLHFQEGFETWTLIS